MCGISGFIAFNELNLQEFSQMNNLIRHRGPDDEGFAFFCTTSQTPVLLAGEDTSDDVMSSGYSYSPKLKLSKQDSLHSQVGLGHRRLSIVDISAAGHQPMCSSDQRYWIVYNGEIYNYIELRQELESYGHIFHSQTDTEVILAAYGQWGNDCLNKLNGMFAFLLYDYQEKVLFAARDRFGIKPLYYWISPDGLAFASEIKQFTVLSGWKPVMNGQRVYDFLNWGLTDHTDETLFKDVFQLRGGQFLEIPLSDILQLKNQKRLPVSIWYEIENKELKLSFEEASYHFQHLFEESIRLRLRADVPVGSCLSGGLDSSSIVCTMDKLLAEQDGSTQQKTFSACTDVKELDERSYINEVVNCTKVDPHFVYPDLENLFKDNDRLTWHQDEPSGSTSIYAQWCVFELAKQSSVKVMLDGQGADEQLAGYHGFFAARYASLFCRFQWIKLWQEIAASRRIHGYSLAHVIKQIGNVLLPEFLRQAFRKLSKKPFATPGWINMKKLGATPDDPFYNAGQKTRSIRDLSRIQLTATSLPMLLHWEDRNSMAHSIEARVPFLDYKLVEFLVNLPDAFKVSDGITKRVLREGLKGALPEKIRQRMDKLGFVTPEEAWVRNKNTQKFREEVIASIKASNGILSNEVLEMFDEIISGTRPFSFIIWRLISFGSWVKTFQVATPE